MGKWDTSSQRRDQAKKSIDTAQTKSDTMAGQIYNPMLAERQGAVNRGSAEREAVRSNYSDIAGGKGAAGDVINNLRGMRVGGTNPGDYGSYGGFQDFSKTGGYTDQDKADIRSRSTSAMPALYASGKAEAARRSSIQGGYSPGYTASMAKLARGTGQGLTEATRNAEIDLAGSVRGNRLAGLTGMSDIEKSAAQNSIYGAQLGSSNERWIGDQQLQANNGLLNLYTAAPGEQSMYDRNMMGMYGMQTGANQGLVGSRVSLAGQGDWMDQGMQGMGATSGLMNAFSGMPMSFGSPKGGDPYPNQSYGTGSGEFTDPATEGQGEGWVSGDYGPGNPPPWSSSYGIQAGNQPPAQYIGNSNPFGSSSSGMPYGYNYGQYGSTYNPKTGKFQTPGSGGGGGGQWDQFYGNGYGGF